jgi:hypothetical protein
LGIKRNFLMPRAKEKMTRWHWEIKKQREKVRNFH